MQVFLQDKLEIQFGKSLKIFFFCAWSLRSPKTDTAMKNKAKENSSKQEIEGFTA